MPMSTPDLDWQVAESEAEWERLASPPAAVEKPAVDPALRLRRSARRAVALLLLMASAGGWGWRPGTATLPPPTAGVTATAQAELTLSAQHDGDLAAGSLADQNDITWWLQNSRSVNSLKAAVQSADAKSRQAIELQKVEFQGDQVVARVVMYTDHGEPAYRQTRFYQRIGPDWRQMTPDAALWGPARSLETPSLLYHFHQNDAQAVIAVTPHIEELYTTLRRNFGLPSTQLVGQPFALIGEKWVIRVSVTQPPGSAMPWYDIYDPIRVPSPAVYLAPVELTDADLLAQSIFLLLLKQVIVEARERNAIGAHWQPILDGLRLWHVWETDLPLSGWREHIIPWIYLDLPGAPPEQPFMLPEQYAEICASHTLWMAMPVQLGIPLFCAEIDETALFYSMWGRRHPPTQLSQIALPTSDYEPAEGMPIWGQTVALATLIEYAVATYGRERLPVLLAGLGQYDTWETLIPAVYGVSASEFERGWQGYLAAQYGLSLDTAIQE
jgi:hypothetical protein